MEAAVRRTVGVAATAVILLCLGATSATSLPVGVGVGHRLQVRYPTVRAGQVGIIAVGDRRAEDGDHGVADELLHGAFELLDLGFDPVEVHAEGVADVLGIGTVGSRSRADEVDEQDRDQLALLGGRPGGGEGAPARLTEASRRGVLRTAPSADEHGGTIEHTTIRVEGRRTP